MRWKVNVYHLSLLTIIPTDTFCVLTYSEYDIYCHVSPYFRFPIKPDYLMPHEAAYWRWDCWRWCDPVRSGPRKYILHPMRSGGSWCLSGRRNLNTKVFSFPPNHLFLWALLLLYFTSLLLPPTWSHPLLFWLRI